jgi:hypothetical protein
MTGSNFDGLTRQIGRRRTLQSLGGAAVAAVSGIALAEAKGGKSNKQKNKQRKKKREKLQQRIDQESLALCAGQVAECIPLITAGCDGSAECLALGQTCCQELADCDFEGLLACFAQQSNS